MTVSHSQCTNSGRQQSLGVRIRSKKCRVTSMGYSRYSPLVGQKLPDFPCLEIHLTTFAIGIDRYAVNVAHRWFGIRKVQWSERGLTRVLGRLTSLLDDSTSIVITAGSSLRRESSDERLGPSSGGQVSPVRSLTSRSTRSSKSADRGSTIAWAAWAICWAFLAPHSTVVTSD